VQRLKDGVRLLQIQGGRKRQVCASWQRGGRHELKQARVGRDRTSVAVRSLSEDVILLCENEAVLCAIKKWVGQGGKATLATAPDADILREIVCLLTQRVQAGRATFLIKVKSHRGEPTNERADTLAEEGREISDDDKRWDDRTDRMTRESVLFIGTEFSILYTSVYPPAGAWCLWSRVSMHSGVHRFLSL
jgi:ribonuclease HI